jgi:hypothetical protein
MIPLHNKLNSTAQRNGETLSVTISQFAGKKWGESYRSWFGEPPSEISTTMVTTGLTVYRNTPLYGM